MTQNVSKPRTHYLKKKQNPKLLIHLNKIQMLGRRTGETSAAGSHRLRVPPRTLLLNGPAAASCNSLTEGLESPGPDLGHMKKRISLYEFNKEHNRSFPSSNAFGWGRSGRSGHGRAHRRGRRSRQVHEWVPQWLCTPQGVSAMPE